MTKSKFIRHWVMPDEGSHQLIDKVLVEDLLNNLPRDMKIWINYHQSENEEQVAELMQLYLSNRKDINSPRSQSSNIYLNNLYYRLKKQQQHLAQTKNKFCEGGKYNS